MQNRTLTGTVAALGIFAAVGLLVALALSSVGPNLAHAQNAEATVATDRAALMALYNSTGGRNWKNQSNWRSKQPLNTWYGVYTDQNGRVTTLKLDFNRLRGPFPAALGNLTDLTYLNLYANSLHGPIPDSLGNLTNLTNLHLGHNHLSGEIPAALGNLTNLTSLNLNTNNFSGEIPASLGHLTNLTNLDLWQNQLSGPIPALLGNLTNLTRLQLRFNKLSGEIPASLGNLTNLAELNLSMNQLSGPIPASLGNLTNLRHLYLSDNQLSGPIPASLGNLTNLRHLYLSNNQLSGPIPASLGSLRQLVLLYLQNNMLTGAIPASLGNLTNLAALNLSNNQLSGPIPASLGNLTNLTTLDMQHNRLSGPIPASLGNLIYLRNLYLLDNELSGPIPEALGNLNGLDRVRFAGNSLTGCMPHGLRYLLAIPLAAPPRAPIPAHDFIALNLPFCMLSALSLSDVTLQPAFATGAATYTASVANSVASTAVTATLYAANDTVAVLKGTDRYTSGDAVPLNVGSNVITIEVTPPPDTTPKQTYTVTVTRQASTTPTHTPTATEPQFPGQIAADSSVTGAVVAEGTTLGVNGGADQPGGVYVNFPPTTVGAPVNVSVSVSNDVPSDVAAPSGTTLLPLSIDITPATPFTLGEPLTIEINPTPEQLAAAGGDLNHLSVGVVTPNGIQVLPVQVVNGNLVVTVDHLSTFTLLAVTIPGPTLTQPPMGDASSMGPLLQWTQPPGTTWFHLQVVPFNNDGPGTNLIIGDGALVQAAQYQIAAPNFGSADPNYVMLPDMTYIWRVRTTTVTTNPTEADWSAWSVSAFKTPPASSSTITPVAPEINGEVTTRTPTLTWANSNTTVFYYEVQVSKDNAFGPNAFLYSVYVHGGASTPPNSYVVPDAFPLEASTTYYWRVRPRIQGDGDPLPWSATYVFRAPG